MFKIFYLSQCGYSKTSLKIINKYKLAKQSDQINCDDQNNFLQDPDSKYVLSDYSTYPKILYLPDKSKPIFVGGNSELEKLVYLVDSKEIVKCKKIPSQRFVNKKNTCKIILDLVDKIYPNP
jgi:glutaredoxin-related protein